MKYLVPILLLTLTACGQSSTNGCAGLEVDHAWIREAPPGMDVTAGYMQLNNSTDHPIVVDQFSSPAFARVELHEMKHENGQMQMRKKENLTIPGTEGLDLQPGGWHLMLFDAVSPLTIGQNVDLDLHCDNDVMTTTAEIRKGGPAQHERNGQRP